MRDRLLELLRKHGWNATSFQVVETDFQYWFEDDAAVAYIDTGGAWVVAGSPIASVEDVGEVAERFIEHAKRNRKRVAFFAVEPRFLWRTGALASLQIGEQPTWDPHAWVERHRGHRGLKEQLRRARAKGVVVEHVPSNLAAGAQRANLERLITRWAATRVMPPMSFLVALEPFVVPEERRYYVANVRNNVIGLLVAVPVYDRGGWFFEDILRDPCAPNGTTESLIDFAMRDVAGDGCTFVTLGLAPLAGDERWLRVARSAMRGFYNFDGLRAFKAKLRPEHWTPIYLAWPRGRMPIAVLFDALDAFAGGHIFRFALRATLRAPSPVLGTLGVLLIPWTIALTLADTKRWFPSRRVQLSWAAFDVAMFAALVSLSRKWRRPLATAACAAATVDGILTTAQAIRYNRARDALVIAAAIAAPFAAAAILFGGLRTRYTSPRDERFSAAIGSPAVSLLHGRRAHTRRRARQRAQNS